MKHPYKMMCDDLPLIVLSDHSSGFIQWAIKWRTKANYNHVMSMIYPGLFTSQGNTFSEVPLDRYMTKNSRLKFWRIKDLTLEEESLIRGRILRRLALPWWKRGYDYLGILGQAVGLKFINNPWNVFCSEQVLKDWLEGIISLRIVDGDNVTELSEHPSPKDLNEFFKNHPRMEVYGRWSSD